MEAPAAQNYWKKCSACKKEIGLRAKYYICSVSTCNGLRTGYVFCSVPCFERHLPGARHKDAAAIEKIAGATPSFDGSESEASPRSQQRIIVKSPSSSTSGTISASPSHSGRQLPREILIVASRLKEYITAKSDMNTSSGVMDVLSDYVRTLADRAIDQARSEGRKTVMERDFDFLKKL